MTQEADKKIAYRIIAKGRVQGVGFRYWTNALAKKMGVKGTVRNCSDYTVEIIAEADKATLDDFMENLKQNHPMANVEELLKQEISVKPYHNFAIIR